MRIAFTIIYQGVQHLLHNNFINRMPEYFDFWCVVEGLSLPGGSTSWCKDLSSDGFSSNDGTRELLEKAAENHDNVYVVLADRPWESKDEQVNKAISTIRSETGVPDNSFLWEVDCDEQWDLESLEKAEKELLDKKGDCGCFHSDYFVGYNLNAIGEWGEGNAPGNPLKNAYRRLWRFDGRLFIKHEPPQLDGGNGREVLLTPRFNHFAYFFEKDVAFKNRYYSGHEGILERWRNLQKEIVFPLPISYLISGPWGKSATQIVPVMYH